MININDYKNNKKDELIYSELLELKSRLSAAIELLKGYNKYIQVMESISVLHNTRTIIEININKYKKILGKNND